VRGAGSFAAEAVDPTTAPEACHLGLRHWWLALIFALTTEKFIVSIVPLVVVEGCGGRAHALKISVLRKLSEELLCM
jgi:hypothetical protein